MTVRRKAARKGKKAAATTSKLGVALRERKEAIEQQAATAEILKVISSSPRDRLPAFDAILKSALRLCDAHLGVLSLREADGLRTVAQRGGSAEFAAWVFERGVFKPDGGAVLKAVRAGKAFQVADALQGADYLARKPNITRFIDLGGVRTFLAVPLLKDGEVIGNIGIYRREVRPFTDRQIVLVKTFADQAVIAIENARLFNDTKEALEQQTATAEILRVISSSPSDMQPVFDSILEHAMRLCDAGLGTVGLYDGQAYRHRAQRGGSPEYVKRLFDEPFVPHPDGTLGRMIAERGPVHIPDYREIPAYRRREPRAVATVELGGARTYLAVPMLKDGQVLGGITIRRTDVRPFTQRQIDLLSTFASQAVIAIENVRLFNETKEALERQTATAEILKVISSSPTDVQPVFDAIAERAAVLCEAKIGVVTKFDGELLHLVAFYGASPELVEPIRAVYPLRPGSGTVTARAVRDRAPAQIPDLLADPDYLPKQESLQAGYRSNVAVPLLREGKVIGALSVARAEAGVFSEKEISLLQIFADQAVIAIENTRLFNETKEALGQQTATAEILKVIASSPTDVQPVFDAIVQSAARLFAPSNVVIVMREGEVMQRKARAGSGPLDQARLASIWPLPFDPERSMAARSVIERRVIEIPDTEAQGLPPIVKTLSAAAGYRAIALVPLIREGEGIGVIAFNRPEPGFKMTEKQLALVRTFADQAVIAIENVRLFNETKEALERQTATAEILKVISGSPTDTRPVLEAIAQSAARLFVPCNVGIGMLENNQIHLRAMAGPRVTQISLEEVAKVYPLPFDPDTVASAKAIVERRVLEFTDMESQHISPVTRKLAPIGGFRSAVIVPLIREGEGIGTIAITHPEAGFRLDQKQLTLLKTFADQAVIAIENVRLFNETKEALERQTATAEILRVISSSPTDVKPVFDTILSNGARLCEANFAALYLYDGEMLTVPAHQGALPELAEAFKTLRLAPSRAGAIRLAALERRIVQVADITKEPGFKPEVLQIQSARTVLGIPLLREKTLVGVLAMWRTEVRPFTDKQIALLKTFADQAVIAIENVRLFKELQSQTEALTKSVSQLTALGEVGQAISSTLDLETVLKTIVARAVQLTGLDGGSIYEYDEQAEEYHLRATENYSAEVVEILRSSPIRRNEGPVWRAGLTGQPTQIPEMRDESYQTPRRELLLRAGYRALLVVPLMRENRIAGALAVSRRSPGAFAPEVVDLLKTFAIQSALAIQNARLFREIAEKGRQLELASEHKSQFLASMSHELRTPLNALLGFNEMLLGGIYGEVPGDMGPPLAQMQSSGKHLLRLINNVLDLAKIEAGRMELALAEYSVHDTVESVRSTLQPLAADKGLEFSAAVPADIPLAYGDPGRITQCLMNLAGNSLKFTKAGKVEISVAADNGLLRYRVADTGIGIPPDKIEGLFTEFKQTDATVASEYGGTGLGLSISKKFVEMHGGRIWAESEPGRGSVFTFEVPLRAKTT